jgi:hypothetical protein
MFVFTDINMEPGSGTKQNRNRKNKKSLEPVSGRQQNPNRNNKKSLPSAMPVRTSSNATRRCAKVA